MWPPSSLEVLLALRIVAIAFQRTMLRTRRSSCSSTGRDGSSCGGIVFRYGVLPAGAGVAPLSWAWPITRSSRNCARCGPSLATTASSASSHSRVSWGSTSTCDAIAAPDLLDARPLWRTGSSCDPFGGAKLRGKPPDQGGRFAHRPLRGACPLGERRHPDGGIQGDV